MPLELGTKTLRDPMPEALDIVADTVARIAAVALLSADVCGCSGCRADGATAVAWALSMVTYESDDPIAPGGRLPEVLSCNPVAKGVFTR